MNEKAIVQITTEAADAVVSFSAVSITDIEQIAAASKQIKQFIDQNNPGRIIFDFEGVNFFSSQVLGMLLEIRSKLKTYNGEVVISAIRPQLHRVFTITGLNKIFKFFPDKQNALRAQGVD